VAVYNYKQQNKIKVLKKQNFLFKMQ